MNEIRRDGISAIHGNKMPSTIKSILILSISIELAIIIFGIACKLNVDGFYDLRFLGNNARAIFITLLCIPPLFYLQIMYYCFFRNDIRFIEYVLKNRYLMPLFMIYKKEYNLAYAYYCALTRDFEVCNEFLDFYRLNSLKNDIYIRTKILQKYVAFDTNGLKIMMSEYNDVSARFKIYNKLINGYIMVLSGSNEDVSYLKANLSSDNFIYIRCLKACWENDENEFEILKDTVNKSNSYTYKTLQEKSFNDLRGILL